jgi:hypothetical protein
MSDSTTTESATTDPPTEDLPEEEQTSDSEKKGTCNLCSNGAPVGYPDMDLTGALLESAGSSYSDLMNELDGVVLTCGLLDQLLASGFFDCEEVKVARKFAGGICGCPPNGANFCDICPNDDQIPLPDKRVGLALDYFPLEQAPTCGQMGQVLTQFKESTRTCFGARTYNYMCGCNNGEMQYFGADNRAKKAALAWITRVSGTLSLLGSILIIWDVLRARSKRASVYHELVCCMSLFDISLSMCYILSSLVTPKYIHGEPSGVYGAQGNDATCTAQGKAR